MGLLAVVLAGVQTATAEDAALDGLVQRASLGPRVADAWVAVYEIGESPGKRALAELAALEGTTDDPGFLAEVRFARARAGRDDAPGSEEDVQYLVDRLWADPLDDARIVVWALEELANLAPEDPNHEFERALAGPVFAGRHADRARLQQKWAYSSRGLVGVQGALHDRDPWIQSWAVTRLAAWPSRAAGLDSLREFVAGLETEYADARAKSRDEATQVVRRYSLAYGEAVTAIGVEGLQPLTTLQGIP